MKYKKKLTRNLKCKTFSLKTVSKNLCRFSANCSNDLSFNGYCSELVFAVFFNSVINVYDFHC